MTLYWGVEVTLLFDSWSTKPWPGYALALFLCFHVSVFSQGLEALRLHLKPNPSQPFADRPETGLAVLFGVNSAIGYLIMLSIMSYNGGVLLAVVLGLTAGYHAFRSEELSDGDDNSAENNTCACA